MTYLNCCPQQALDVILRNVLVCYVDDFLLLSSDLKKGLAKPRSISQNRFIENLGLKISIHYANHENPKTKCLIFIFLLLLFRSLNKCSLIAYQCHQSRVIFIFYANWVRILKSDDILKSSVVFIPILMFRDFHTYCLHHSSFHVYFLCFTLLYLNL